MRRTLLLSLCLCFVTLSLGTTLASALTPMEQLGKDLFFDDNLSTPPGMSCATCHDPTTAFVGPDSDINATLGVYPGIINNRFGNRKPPSAAYASFSPDFHFDEEEGLFVGGMFWDGRALNTIEQAKGPFLNPVEMNNPNMRSVIIKVMKSEYAGLFQDVYLEWMTANNPTPPGAIPELGDLGSAEFVADAYQLVAEAIAAYEASSEVNQFSSKYDAYLAGEAMLTAEELWGLELYEGKAMCNACHPSEPGPGGEPPLFTDFTYDNLGVPRNENNPWYTMNPSYNPDGYDWVDYGLGGRLGLLEEMGKHKVPTLRNVGMRPYPGFVQSYMHNGVFKSLHEVVDFYNSRDVGMWPEPEVAENVNEDELGNLGLTPDEVDAVVAFLFTLTDGYTGAPMTPASRGEDLGSASLLTLNGAFPNPFQAASEIRFTLGARTEIALDIFDLSGRLVRRLLPSQTGLAGDHRVTWNGRDDLGQQVAPGVYFYRLAAGPATKVERVVLLP